MKKLRSFYTLVIKVIKIVVSDIVGSGISGGIILKL